MRARAFVSKQSIQIMHNLRGSPLSFSYNAATHMFCILDNHAERPKQGHTHILQSFPMPPSLDPAPRARPQLTWIVHDCTLVCVRMSVRVTKDNLKSCIVHTNTTLLYSCVRSASMFGLLLTHCPFLCMCPRACVPACVYACMASMGIISYIMNTDK